MKTIVEHLYDKYLSSIIWKGFVPYSIYFVSVLYLFSNQVYFPGSEETDQSYID